MSNPSKFVDLVLSELTPLMRIHLPLNVQLSALFLTHHFVHRFNMHLPFFVVLEYIFI